MPTDCQQIATNRSQTLALLLELRASPKPTYKIDGQSVSWESYVRSLQETVDWCDLKLIGLEPFEVQTRGVT